MSSLANEMVGRNVLIVDDSSTARNQIKGTLSQLGFEHYRMLRWPRSA